MDIPTIVAKVNTEISGCRIIPSGKGWGKVRWLVEDRESGLCKPISQSAIIAMAMERYLLPDKTRAARALGSIRTAKKARSSAENGRKGDPESHRRGGRPKGKKD